jgi:hypothetical protein
VPYSFKKAKNQPGLSPECPPATRGLSVQAHTQTAVLAQAYQLASLSFSRVAVLSIILKKRGIGIIKPVIMVGDIL